VNGYSPTIKEVAMALLINPASGATHYHTSPNANPFQWSNTNPIVPTGTNWRLKIGSAPFGYNYYSSLLGAVSSEGVHQCSIIQTCQTYLSCAADRTQLLISSDRGVVSLICGIGQISQGDRPALRIRYLTSHDILLLLR